MTDKTNVFRLNPDHDKNFHSFQGEDEFEFYEERAAILEYEGLLNRREAEELAYHRTLCRRTEMALVS